MSNKKQIAELTKRLSIGSDNVVEALRIFKEVADEINSLRDIDSIKADETYGVVSANLEKQSEKLDDAGDLLNEAITEIETSSGEAFYCLQELE